MASSVLMSLVGYLDSISLREKVRCDMTCSMSQNGIAIIVILVPIWLFASVASSIFFPGFFRGEDEEQGYCLNSLRYIFGWPVLLLDQSRKVIRLCKRK